MLIGSFATNPALLVPLNLEHDGPNAHPSESVAFLPASF